MSRLKFYILLVIILSVGSIKGQGHPNIMITKENVSAVRDGIRKYPLLLKSFEVIKLNADNALASPINVPTPKDGGGGFTHEQHKLNYNNIFNCGVAYQVTGEKKYVKYVNDILQQYAAQYKNWELHPARKTDQQSGRIFWQSLNDFVWQVYVIQGYDMVYDAISSKDRSNIENNLFLPILKFITVDGYETFNKIHNHGTWAIAATALTGYVLNRPEYVGVALKGSKKDGKTGYWAQLNQLFSPDGYYSEGPYYQRYALYPFLITAKAIHNYQPQKNVFGYRESILAKAVNTCLQLTDARGYFFPVNDAIKDKTFESIELVYGVNIIYADVSADNSLLDIVQQQGRVTVSDAGLLVAKAIAEGNAVPFKYTSQWIRDGKDGSEGGLGILRNGTNTDQQIVLLKAGTQGMGHGHFDRLNLLYYDNNSEIFFDYGAARFLNIESKRGGHYLPENTTWAKQTIAHNTLVVDRSSHFNSNLEKAEQFAPQLEYFSNKDGLQVMSASEVNAYDNTTLKRIVALVSIPELSKPLLLDVVTAISDKSHHYDLPFWYKGQLVATSFNLKAFTTQLKPMGVQNGYQHIWLKAVNQLDKNGGYVGILNNNRFYTTHFISEQPLQVSMVSTGANDPEMSLTHENGFILSTEGKGETNFVSITETHGSVNPTEEAVSFAKTSLSDLSFVTSAAEKISVFFKVKNKKYNVQIDRNNKNNFIHLQ